MQFSCKNTAGLEKNPVHCPGLVDFCVGQVTLPSHLLNGQGYRQAVLVQASKMEEAVSLRNNE